MKEPNFRYRLESLAKLRVAERDALKTEMERAAAQVDSRTRERDAVASEVELAESELRTLNRSGAELMLDVQLRLQGYLKQRREEHGARQRALDEAVRAMHRVLGELELKVKDAKALESHRERKRRQFDALQARASLNAADDQWMRRRNR